MISLWGLYTAPIEWAWSNALFIAAWCGAAVATVMTFVTYRPRLFAGLPDPILWFGVSVVCWICLCLVAAAWPLILLVCLVHRIVHHLSASPTRKGRAA